MNAPFASILVPYDGSEPARAALDLALSAMHRGATLTIVNVVDESPVIAQSATSVTAFDPAPLFAGLDEQARVLLADAVARCARADVVPRTELIHERPAPGVVATAASLGCDLIVMGTHGRGGLSRTFLGSTTEGVLRSCTVPVLTVRAGGPSSARPFDRALVAVDDSEASDAALAIAKRMHVAFGTHLTIANVADTTRLYDNAAAYGFSPLPLENDVERESAHVVATALEHAALTVDAVQVALLEGHPSASIVQAARDGAATMIVTGSHGRRGLRRFFLGSVAEHIVRTSPLPVLVVRPFALSVTRGFVQHPSLDLAANLTEKRL